jgi:hypothetical protein
MDSVGYQIEDYRADLDYIYMYAPIVWFMRCIWINIFLLGGTNMKSGQFYAYLFVEGAYLYYLVKSKVKASQFENWLSFFNEGSQISYILLHIVGYYSNDREFKQGKIGMGQAGVIIIMMLTNIGYVFVVFFWDLLIKPIVNLCKKKPAFPVHPDRMGDEAPELRAQNLGSAVAAKSRVKLVVSRAQLDQYAAAKQPAKLEAQDDSHADELNRLNDSRLESPVHDHAKLKESVNEKEEKLK